MKYSKIRIPLLLLFTLLAIGTGYLMYARFMASELWGYLPLFFLIGIWGAIVLGLQNRFSKHENNLPRLALATLTGVLLWLGFPLMPLTPLMFIGFVPLLLVEDDISRSREGASKWEVFKYSYHALFVWNILTTYWVANTAFAAGIFAFSMNTFFMCIPIVLFHQIKKILGGRLMGISFIAFWITFEYLHMRQDLTWPWLTLGNSFSTYPSWVQWYEYLGVFGGSFWILAGNVLFFKLIQNHYPQLKSFFNLKQTEIAPLVVKNNLLPSGKKGSLITICLLLLLPILISFGIYVSYEDKGLERNIVLVQPNLEPHYVKFDISNTATLNQFMKLSVAAVDETTDYLVFPETSFDGVKTNDFYVNKNISSLKKYVDRFPKLKLITGLGSRKIYEPGETHGPAVRAYARSGRDTIFWESHNSAIQLTSGKEAVDFYLKGKMVPGAEIFPYRKVLWFMEPLVNQLGGSVSGFATQKERSVFEGDGTAVAPVICFESVFGEYCTEYVRKGAEALFIVTNDGWWDNTAGHRQHMAFARLRAIETRRSIARSANMGTCGFINQRGDVSQATAYGKIGTVKGSIRFNNEITFYTIWGDVIGRVALFTTILLLLQGIAKGLLKRST